MPKCPYYRGVLIEPYLSGLSDRRSQTHVLSIPRLRLTFFTATKHCFDCNVAVKLNYGNLMVI